MINAPTTLADVIAGAELARSLGPSAPLPALAPERSGRHTVYPWHPFELHVWEIGERIRQGLSKNPRLRRDPNVFEPIVQIVETPSLGYGRQAFVMCLGFKSAATYAPRIAPFATDSAIGGHVVYSLLKMRAPGYVGQVRPLAQSQFLWIQKLARRYIERYGRVA